MGIGNRVIVVESELLVEFVVFLFGDLAGLFAPERSLLIGLLFILTKVNWKWDEVGVFLDDRLQARLSGELNGIFLEMDDDLGAALVLLTRSNGESVRAGGFPAGCLGMNR